MFVIEDLLWDEWNLAHIRRHQVTQADVEQVRKSDYVYWETYGGRFMLVGMTTAEKLISIVLADKGAGIYYPVTARTASRKERRRYWELRGGEQAA